jgi:hypothetical protein
VELQTRSIKSYKPGQLKQSKLKPQYTEKNAVGRESKNEQFILEIESDGRLVGTISNSACFTVSHVHSM